MGFFNRDGREPPRAATMSMVPVPIPQSLDPPPYIQYQARAQTAPVNTNSMITQQKPLSRSGRTHLSSAPGSVPPVWNQPLALETCTKPRLPDNQMVCSDTIKQVQHSADQEAVDEQLGRLSMLIDEGTFHGTEQDLVIDLPLLDSSAEDQTSSARNLERPLVRFDVSITQSPNRPRAQSRSQNRSINILSKVSYYSNSRLPPDLPPFRVYIPTWPLLCLAAQYSSSAYNQPASIIDQATHIAANPRLGTKAMVVKDVCFDDRKVIVFAIRGTSVFSLKDWNVNLSHKPSSPSGFLDDDGNLCHSGFLKVAKAMVQPIARRLRTLLEQNPSRSACSLIITGHSAGGAVASLIYSHMLSEVVKSDLTILTSCFKRVHCITFGSPPISLLPLTKPESRSKKSLFHSFINEGDPVVRAEPIFLRSLIDLLTTSTPSTRRPNPPTTTTNTTTLICASLSKLDLNICPSTCQSNKLVKQQPKPTNTDAYNVSTPPSTSLPSSPTKPTWHLPPTTLSNAGRLIILRVPPYPASSSPSHTHTTQGYLAHEFSTVSACIATDSQLRSCIFGNLPVHSMEIYRRRIEALSFRAVTGRLD